MTGPPPGHGSTMGSMGPSQNMSFVPQNVVFNGQGVPMGPGAVPMDVPYGHAMDMAAAAQFSALNISTPQVQEHTGAPNMSHLHPQHPMANVQRPASGVSYPSAHPQQSHPSTALRTAMDFGIEAELRRALADRELHRNRIAALAAADGQASQRPKMVKEYHSFHPLEKESNAAGQAGTFSLFRICNYEAVSAQTGSTVNLCRVKAPSVQWDSIPSVLERWRNIEHPNLIQLQDGFHSREWQTSSDLFLVYDLHPLSQTVRSRYFSPYSQELNESQIWCIVSQLLVALQCLHTRGLAYRCLDLDRVLVSGPGIRIRLARCGMMDILFPLKSGKDDDDGFSEPLVREQQSLDLFAMGRFLLMLVTRNANATPDDIGTIPTSFSSDLRRLITHMLTQWQHFTVYDLVTTYARYFVNQWENQMRYTDVLEGELGKELNNARLFRLLSKLNYVVDRPQFQMDASWSDTGDRYPLKLFRDYLFYQAYDNGAPILDLGHIVDSLHKLDIGSPERVLLMSRDGKALLVVAFADLKRCLFQAWTELLNSYRGVRLELGSISGTG